MGSVNASCNLQSYATINLKELRKEIAIKLEEEQEHEDHMEELRQAEIAEKTIDLTKHSRFTKYK